MRNRLHALCPYFAMFPETFVERQVARFTKPGEYVFDPFSGRGTTSLQSLLMERRAVALDINPVAFCITGAKSIVPSAKAVQERITALEWAFAEAGSGTLDEERKSLPAFFDRAFHSSTLKQLLFLRRCVSW